MPLTVMIVDDHAVVRDGLKRLLSLEEYQVIAAVGSAEELFSRCRNSLPDLVVMDLSMPGMGGVEGLRRLMSKWPELKVIIFSIYQNPRLANRVLSLGGKGYVTKSCESTVINEAIKTVLAGKQYLSPDISKASKANSNDPLHKLSAREFDIFRCIADGLETRQISEKLFLSEKTVANNISIIKKKLAVNSRSEMYHLAIREGLLLTDC